MITALNPLDWRDLQNQVADILSQCGFKVEVEKKIEGARGSVEIDVYAEERIQGRKYVVACECKHWMAGVPQTVIHAFRTVVGDIGANMGILITTSKFQSGAKVASEWTNLKLLNWHSFQDEFELTWYSRHFKHYVQRLTDGPYYTCGPYEVRNLPEPQRTQIDELLDKYNELTAAVRGLINGQSRNDITRLPLRAYAHSDHARELLEDVPENIQTASGYRDLLYLLLERKNHMLAQARNIVPTSHGFMSFTPWHSEYIFDYVSEEDWGRAAAHYCRPPSRRDLE